MAFNAGSQSRLEIVIDSRTGERNLRRLESELERTERAGTRTFTNLRSLAMGFAGALGAIGVTTGMRASISTIAEFQAAMNGLAAVSGATAEQMQQLERQARLLGATSQFSAQQAGEAQRFLAQAGFEVNEVLSSTPGILQLATAGSLDLASAADIASNVLGGMRMEVGELSRVNDVLAATAARSNTTIEQLGQALSFAAPFAASAGISIEELSAAIGVMSDAGIQASRAGTGMVGVIRQLSRITSTGQAVLERYGLSMADVSIESRGLGPVLETLRKANLDTAAAIELFGSEAGAAAQVLVSDYKGAITGATGEADRMAKQMEQGLIPAFRGLGSAISEATLQMGDTGFAGGLETLVRAATGVISVWNGMEREWAGSSEELQRMLPAVQGVATALEALAVLAGGRLVVAMGAAASATVAKTAASMADARAEAVAAQQTVRRTAAELQAANTIRARAIADARATAGTNAHAFAMQNLTAASARATAAQNAHTAATNVYTAAATRASVVARGFAGALGLLGGPVGAAVIAAGAIYYFREELNGTASQSRRTAERVDDLTNAINTNSEAAVRSQLVNLTGQMFDLERQAIAAREEIDRLTRDSSGPSGVLGVAPGRTGEQARAIQELGRIAEEMDAVGKSSDRLRGILDALRTEGTTPTVNSVRDLADGTEKLTKAQRDAIREAEQFAGAFRSLHDQLRPVEASQRRYREEVDLLNAAHGRAREMLDAKLITEEEYNSILRDRSLLLQELEARYRDSTMTASSAYGGVGFGSQIGDPRTGMGADREREQEGYWERWLESASKAFTDFDQMAANTAENFQRGFGQAFETMIFDSENLGEAVHNMADGMARTMIRALGEMAAQWIVYQGVQMATGRAMESTAVAGASAAGASMAAAYAPAAAAASLASFGANSAPAMAGITATHALSQSLALAGMAHDGIDKVPREGTWLLDKGERVVSRPQADRLDRFLDKQNGGGSGGSMNVYITTPPGAEARTEERQNAQGGRDLHVIIDEATAQNLNNPGSRTGRAMQQRFGAQRTLTGR